MPLIPFTRMTVPGGVETLYSGERLVNLFARKTDDAVAPLALLGRGGLVEYARLPGPVRAMVEMGGQIYAVAGGRVWRMYGPTPTEVGRVADGPTTVAANISEIAITAGGNYYVCNGSTTTRYTPGALTRAHGVEYADGYFIVIGSASDRDDAVQISALDDGTAFNALDFAFAETSPDPLVGILRDHGEIYLFGTRTIQVFYNSGDADFPFTPNRGAGMEHGCIGGETVAKADNAVFWVRPDGAVQRSFGSSPEVISTSEVKDALASSTVAGAHTFSERGAEFYAVSREGGTTLVFDISTGLWHERSTGLLYGPWAATCSLMIDGATYLGCGDGRIATMGQGVFTDFDGPLMAEAVSLPVEQAGERFRVARLHMNVRGGGVLDRAPRAMLQLSRDGVTWGGEKWRDIGGRGNYWRRATWHNLGLFRRAQARIRITDPVPRDIYGVSYV